MGNLESHVISILNFPGLESHGKMVKSQIWSWKVMKFQFLIKIVVCALHVYYSVLYQFPILTETMSVLDFPQFPHILCHEKS